MKKFILYISMSCFIFMNFISTCFAEDDIMLMAVVTNKFYYWSLTDPRSGSENWNILSTPCTLSSNSYVYFMCEMYLDEEVAAQQVLTINGIANSTRGLSTYTLNILQINMYDTSLSQQQTIPSGSLTIPDSTHTNNSVSFSIDIFTTDSPVNYLQVWCQNRYSAGTYTFSFSIDRFSLNDSGSAAGFKILEVLQDVKSDVKEIRDFIYNYLLSFMTSVVQALNSIITLMGNMQTAIVSAIDTNGSNIVSSINSMSTRLFDKLTIVDNDITRSVDEAQMNIVSSVDYMRDTLNNSLNRLFDSNDTTNSSTGKNDNTTSDFNNSASDYDDIENTAVNDFSTNLGNVDNNNSLITDSSFLKSTSFISTQLTQIYESNNYIRYMVNFSLIMGLALTIIGIKVKR